MKTPRKPKTPSIKEHLTNAGYPDAHKLAPSPQCNTSTDKDDPNGGEKPSPLDKMEQAISELMEEAMPVSCEYPPPTVLK